MTGHSINADVTMVDASRSGTTRGGHNHNVIDKTINADVTMAASPSSGGLGRFRPGDEILGRYVVESELGQGGMGVVYLCLDRTGGVKVAVKGLPPEVSHNFDEMEAVRDNYQLVSSLQHQNIATVRHLEKDTATGNYFLVMTYARGVSLKRWLRDHNGREHRTEQLKILRQIAAALDYAHNAEPRHIIHRDIKPENVMVDEHGNAMVLDFGLAAQVRSSLSRVSQVVTSRSGTPAYKSPEQWLAQPQRAPSDQYSLGVIAYQMFTGELPFDSDDVEILKHAVAFDRVPKIRGEGKKVNAVFAKVLAKKPQDRFPSCTTFVDALEGKIAGGNAVSDRMLVVVIGALVAFISLCGWWVWKTEQDVVAEQQAEAARRQEQNRREAEQERLAEESRRKEETRAAAAKSEADHVAVERRKAEESSKAATRAEAARKAKAEADRIAKEKAEAERAAAEKATIEAEKRRQQGEAARRRDAKALTAAAKQKAIALFKNGEWKSGLEQAERADQEDAELLFWLGTCYDMGLGEEGDVKKSIECFRRAAEKGQIDAQCELARRYESGRGVNKDLSQAKRWYQTAASQGSKTAEQNLSRLYGQQDNVAANEKISAQRRKEREDAERIASELEEIQKLKEEVSRLKDAAKQNLNESPRAASHSEEKRPIVLSGRSSVKFTREDASTLSSLEFSSSIAKSHYEKACSLAREGAHNKAKVKSEYNQGRGWGGPEWPELEAWLEWWK